VRDIRYAPVATGRRAWWTVMRSILIGSGPGSRWRVTGSLDARTAPVHRHLRHDARHLRYTIDRLVVARP
jgi:hypothetical protein